MIINGDGEQTRDFTFIEDVIQANELAAIVEDKAALNTVYNISFGQGITLNGLAQKMKESFESLKLPIDQFKLIHGPKRAGDIEHSYASIEKAKSLLNFAPKFPLEEGIKNYLEYLIQTDPTF